MSSKRKAHQKTTNADRFNEFKPYQNSIPELNLATLRSQLNLGLISDDIEPIFHDTPEGGEWILETDQDIFSFSPETKKDREQVPYFNQFNYLAGWLLGNWQYLLSAVFFLALILLSPSLKQLLATSTNWLLIMLKKALEYEPIPNISIFSGGCYILLLVELLIFVAKQAVNFPHQLSEQIAANRLQAKLNLVEREKKFRAKRIQEVNAKLDEIEQKQIIIQRARSILENQIFEDKENRLVLTERLGAEQLPVTDENLGSLILTCLGNTYFQKKNPVPLENINH